MHPMRQEADEDILVLEPNNTGAVVTADPTVAAYSPMDSVDSEVRCSPAALTPRRPFSSRT